MDSRFIVTRQGKQFCLFAGLLDEAHRQGLKRVTTMLIQVPTPENEQTAIVTAEVETERGRFCGIGDASPTSVARPVVPHLIRLAETRAKARALRDAVNVGVAAPEELGADADEPSATPRPTTPHGYQRQRQQNQHTPRAATSIPAPGGERLSGTAPHSP